jgi:hypothetical protein
MRICLPVLLFLAAGCSGGGEADNAAAPAAPEARAPSRAAPANGELSTLIGLYEGGKAGQPDQMCIVERDGGQHFGLVVWGANMHSCSGSGTATREGETLRLAMAGDRTCAIDARIDGTIVTFPPTLPEGCAYYCGARANLANASLTQKGTTPADAAKAKDLVGEPLCGS